MGARPSYYDYYIFTGKIEDIKEEYLSGVSTVALSKKYEVSERTIANWLIKQNVTLRPSGKISKIDQNIFKEIDTEIKAYTLGLIMSDGNVSKDKYGNTISITLTQDDKYILETINEKLLSNQGNICITHKEDKKPRAVLQFNGKQIKETLATYGIVPNKSHLLTQLPKNISPDLYHHFLRGLYDGDGICSYYTNHGRKQKVRIGFCGANYDFVKDYQDFFVSKLNLNKTKIFNTGGCFQCSWASQKNLEDFFDFIYKDATIYLGRKYKKLKDFLNKQKH